MVGVDVARVPWRAHGLYLSELGKYGVGGYYTTLWHSTARAGARRSSRIVTAGEPPLMNEMRARLAPQTTPERQIQLKTGLAGSYTLHQTPRLVLGGHVHEPRALEEVSIAPGETPRASEHPPRAPHDTQ